jgi:hypothetical protein
VGVLPVSWPGLVLGAIVIAEGLIVPAFSCEYTETVATVEYAVVLVLVSVVSLL